MADRYRVECPVCGRIVSAYVPRGGDGTALRPHRHVRTVDVGRGHGVWKNVPCEGRFHTVDLPTSHESLTDG